MTTRNLGRHLTVASVALNLVLATSLVLVGLSSCRVNTPGPSLQAVTFQTNQEVGGHLLCQFGTDMTPRPDAAPCPVVVSPAFEFELVWQDATRALLLPESPLPPGKQYVVRTTETLRDTQGRAVPETRHAVTTHPLTVAEFGQPEHVAPGHTRVCVTFNGPVSPVELVEHMHAFDDRGKSVRLKAVLTAPLRSPTIEAFHRSEARTLRLTVRAGLRAHQAEYGLAANETETVALSTALTIGGLTTDTDRSGMALRFSASGQISSEAAARDIEVTPHVTFRLRPDYRRGRHRLVGPFHPRTFYRITFREGLRATDGRSLAEDTVRTVLTGSLRPRLEFVTRGPFLPHAKHSQLPVRVCNVEEIRATATRIYPNNLVAFWRDGSYSADENGPVTGNMLFTPNVGPDTLKIVNLPLHELFADQGAGIYLITARDTDRYWTRGTRTVVRTDLALTVKASDREVVAWVLRLSDNTPVAGCALQVLSQRNQALGTGRTDANGVAHITLAANHAGDETPYLLVARKGKDISLLRLGGEFRHNLAQFELPQRTYPGSHYEAFVYSERGVCRPGEQMTVSFLVRDRTLQPVSGVPAELVVTDPGGKTFLRRRLELDTLGFATAAVPVPPHARTGQYVATVGIPEVADSATARWGRCQFSVACYTPDRIRLDLRLDREHCSPGEELGAELAAAYYFGRPAAFYNGTLTAAYAPVPFAPKTHSAFVFGDTERAWQQPRLWRNRASTDEQGKLSCAVPMPAGLRPPAAVAVTVASSVQEPGGRAVSAQARAVLHCYPVYVGLRALWDASEPPAEQLRFAWTGIAPDETPTAPTQPLEFELLRQQWHYALSADSNGQFARRWTRELTPVATGEVTVNAGETAGELALACPEPGSYCLLVSDPVGGARTRLSFYYWQGDGGRARPTNTAFLRVLSDRSSYRPGGEAVLSFDAPAQGAALICVGADRLHTTTPVAVAPGRNDVRIRLPVTPFGSAYASVTVVHDEPLPDDAGRPRRLFGLLHLEVDQRKHRLSVDIAAEDLLVPGEQAAIRIDLRENGAPTGGKVQLFGVDEGILALTGYTTPDPFEFFHGQRRCAFEFGDVYDHLFPELRTGAGLASAIGGGGGLDLRNPIASKQIQPAVFVLPVATIPDTGTQTLTVDLPDHTGALRLMAVAWTPDTVGSAEREVALRHPVTVQLTAPRAVAPGDEFEGTAQLFNHDADADSAHLVLSVTGPVRFLSSPSARLDLAQGREKTVPVRFRALPDQAGPVVITADLRVGDARHRTTAAFSVRPPSPPVYRSGYAVIKPGTEDSIELPGAWLRGTAEARLTVSSSVDVEILGAFEWLRRYPYGCLEQTISGAFPVLYTRAIPGLAEQLSPDAAHPFGHAVERAIRRIMLMELPRGGFAMWPGNSRAWHAGSVYAAHFLIEARNCGFELDQAVWRRTVDYLRAGVTRSSRGLSTEDRAYGLYLLALADQPLSGLAESMVADQAVSALARALAAAALIRGGRARTGAEALHQALKDNILNDECTWDMDTPVRRTALVLNALLDVTPDHPEVVRLLNMLRRTRTRNGHWGQTQSNAMAVLALGKWLTLSRPRANSRALVVDADGQRHNAPGTKPLVLKPEADAGSAFTVHALGPGPAYAAWYTRGVPLVADAHTIVEGMTVERTYLDAKGKPATTFEQGDLVTVKIALHSPAARRNIAVADLLPGCLEIEDASLRTRWAPSAGLPSNLNVDFVERLDDRLLLFCSLPKDRQATFTYTARAVSRGRFAEPRICAEAMYEPEVQASTGGGATIVVN